MVSPEIIYIQTKQNGLKCYIYIFNSIVKDRKREIENKNKEEAMISRGSNGGYKSRFGSLEGEEREENSVYFILRI